VAALSDELRRAPRLVPTGGFTGRDTGTRLRQTLKTLVLGARGDMTGRLLLPALVQLAGAGGLPSTTAILAVDRDPGDDETYRARPAEARRAPA
jgi:glucose-6-phosphate 1-dehydrogenase